MPLEAEISRMRPCGIVNGKGGRVAYAEARDRLELTLPHVPQERSIRTTRGTPPVCERYSLASIAEKKLEILSIGSRSSGADRIESEA